MRVYCNKRPSKAIIKTLPYPGFPTDMQSQMGVILSIADGTSIINESIWESRFQYTEELNKMGAKITAQGKTAFFEGVKELTGAPVYASDLRAGAALIVAGIIAKGTTDIYNVEYIDRGYENIEQKFKNLGAKIERVEEKWYKKQIDKERRIYMLNFCSLYSGSSGNCLFVETANSKILIDAGVSLKKIEQALRKFKYRCI